MGYSMGQLLKLHRPFTRSPDVKLSFSYHYAQASPLDTPTKKYEAVEMCAKHLAMPGTMAAGEFGIDHWNKTPEARHHSWEFLSQMAKKWSRTPALRVSFWFFMSVRSVILTKRQPASAFPHGAWPPSIIFARFISTALLVLLRQLCFGLAILKFLSLGLAQE